MFPLRKKRWTRPTGNCKLARLEQLFAIPFPLHFPRPDMVTDYGSVLKNSTDIKTESKVSFYTPIEDPSKAAGSWDRKIGRFSRGLAVAFQLTTNQIIEWIWLVQNRVVDKSQSFHFLARFIFSPDTQSSYPIKCPERQRGIIIG